MQPTTLPQRDSDGYLTELERDASLVLRNRSEVPGEATATAREVDEMPRDRFDAAVEHLWRQGLGVLSAFGTMRGVTEAGRARVLAGRDALAKLDAAISALPEPAPMPAHGSVLLERHALDSRLSALSRDIGSFMRPDGSFSPFTQGGDARHAITMAFLGDGAFQRMTGADAVGHLRDAAPILWA